MTIVTIKNKRPNKIYVNGIGIEVGATLDVDNSEQEIKNLLKAKYIEQVGETKDEGTSKKVKNK